MTTLCWGRRLPVDSPSHEDCWEPTNLTARLDSDGATITSIACGDRHALFATSEGDVLAIGNNNHGQCGNDCSLSCGPTDTRRVVSLDHEFVTMVAASANSSFALTQSGKVYRFGLIHAYENSGESNEEKDGEEDNSAIRGHLTGMVSDADAVMVNIDQVARSEQALFLKSSTVNPTPYDARTLSSIVKESASRWMIADGHDADYYDELRGMGYTKEDDEAKIQERGHEYHGMLKLGCKRMACATPQLISSPLIDNLRIVSVACGYSHFMLLSSCGRLFSAGYNDRGNVS